MSRSARSVSHRETKVVILAPLHTETAEATTRGFCSMGLLRQRRRQPEIMDQPDLCPRRHARALAALSRINALSATQNTYWRPLRELQSRLGLPRLSILDVACGGGDVSRRLSRLAEENELDWRIGGCD